MVRDSCFIKNEVFRFSGNTEHATPATLKGNVKSIADDDPNSVGFYLEASDIAVSGTYDRFKELKFTGSRSQQERELLNKQIIGIKDMKERAVIIKRFIKEHPGSYVSAFNLMLYRSRFEYDTVKNLLNGLHADVKDSYFAKRVSNNLALEEPSIEGRQALDFTNTDINGKSLSLSAFKGKYVLLDFWGSWCEPCREGNPHLIRIYKKYQPKGLEIIGIASDEDVSAWRKAVADDQVGIWHNVLSGIENGPGWPKDRSQWITTKYHISLYPTKILLNPEGIIIARYNGGIANAVIDNKLKEIFGE